MPTARVLAIGDELLLGRTVDTNSAHASRVLGDLGLRVDRLTVVGDRQAEIERALADVCAGADLVVATGGLGPTDDDRTRHALAAAMGVELVEDAAAWRAVVAHYRRIGRGGRVPPANRRQALMPLGARMLANDRGTAPGILAKLGGCWVAAMPGVPHEMTAMLDRLAALLPRLVRGLAPPAIGEVWFSGIGESTAQELLDGLLSESDPQVGITVSELGHLTLRVVGRQAAVRSRVAELRRRLARWLLPLPGLAPSLVAELTRRGWTVTAAESCTCGHVAALLGAVPGASRVLREATVTYAESAKRARLAVDPRLIARHGVVSREVALAMAEGARRAAGADLGLATTGVAGPDGGSRAVPVGTVWCAAATAAGAIAVEHRIAGSRERVQRRAAAQAMLIGWRTLSETGA